MSSKELEMKALEHDVSDATYEAAAECAATVYEKIEQGVVSGYKKIEQGVVGGYKKMETGIVEGFQKVTDKCVEVLFAKEGETVENAKKRLSGKESAAVENEPTEE